MNSAQPSAIDIARTLLRDTGSAALATLGPDGAPFASYVTVAPADDNSPLLLLSRLALHTRNIGRDARASLLLVREPPAGSPSVAAQRLSLTGRLLADTNPHSERLFLARHPEAAQYAGFADFSVYRFDVEAGHLVAGFGIIRSLGRADLIVAENG